MNLTVIILTFNEAHHIKRAISSVALVSHRVFIVDSGSTDDTVVLAKTAGAEVLVHPFVNQAQQFNWALSQMPPDTTWILRLDADELVTPELAEEINERLPDISADVSGIYVSRRMAFLRKRIMWGGVFPIRIVRIFRFGKGRSEHRWMDEHIVVEGKCVDFSGEIIDDNIGTLTSWIEKHNTYSSREVVDVLSRDFGLIASQPSSSVVATSGSPGIKRWVKEHVYSKLPGGLRAFIYFFYRFVLRMGFLDGYRGTTFHVLQAFWYRYLVDAKLFEVKQYMSLHKVDVKTAIRNVLGIDPNLF